MEGGGWASGGGRAANDLMRASVFGVCVCWRARVRRRALTEAERMARGSDGEVFLELMAKQTQWRRR